MSSEEKPEPKPLGFLQEDNGNISSMRLMSFIALLAAVGLAGASLYVSAQGIDTDQSDIFLIILAFLSAAFGGKIAQKFAEAPAKKTEDNPPKK